MACSQDGDKAEMLTTMLVQHDTHQDMLELVIALLEWGDKTDATETTICT